MGFPTFGLLLYILDRVELRASGMFSMEDLWMTGVYLRLRV